MARERKKTEEQAEGAPEWMVTYGDMVTLLLTFFVMLFSMASLDVQKFKIVANSLASAFNQNTNGDRFLQNQGEEIIKVTDDTNTSDTEQSEHNTKPNLAENEFDGTASNQNEQTLQQLNAQKLEEVKEKIEEAIKEHNLQEYVKVIEEKSALVLRLNEVILFDLGKADIKIEGQGILIEIGGMLKSLDNEITIEGHTDNLPINTVQFPSNWELSAKRAINVLNLFAQKSGVDDTKLIASGRADRKPVDTNDTKEGRARNRRIDIVVDKYLIDENTP